MEPALNSHRHLWDGPVRNSASVWCPLPSCAGPAGPSRREAQPAGRHGVRPGSPPLGRSHHLPSEHPGSISFVFKCFAPVALSSGGGYQEPAVSRSLSKRRAASCHHTRGVRPAGAGVRKCVWVAGTSHSCHFLWKHAVRENTD